MENPRLLKVAFRVLVLTAATAIASSAQTLTTLHNFAGRPNDGAKALAGLVQGTDGNFYGTTRNGGSSDKGTVFRITANGTITILHSFAGTDGQDPEDGLIQARDGNFYGTTSIGGSGGSGGTVFKITPGGTLTTLATFDGQGGPEFPESGLIQARDGNFYGTTDLGGTHFGNGTVYRITPNGTVTTLYSFSCSDSSGCRPVGGLVQGSDGNFYGTTSQGGSGSNGGAVFKITSNGTVTTLYSFCSLNNCADGNDSLASLIQASDGNFYGTTNGGGAHSAGTVFKITPEGTLTTLYSFCVSGSPCADGNGPEGSLVQGSDGNFYGSTYLGGANNVGSIFQVTPQGALTTLHSFNGGDGAAPYDGLVEATDGNFYGTTSTGGSSGDGTVFQLTPPPIPYRHGSDEYSESFARKAERHLDRDGHGAERIHSHGQCCLRKRWHADRHRVVEQRYSGAELFEPFFRNPQSGRNLPGQQQLWRQHLQYCATGRGTARHYHHGHQHSGSFNRWTVGDHHRDGRPLRTSAADRHGQLHIERYGDLRLHECRAVEFANRSLYDVSVADGHGHRCRQLLRRRQLLAQPGFGGADRESHPHGSEIRDAAAVPHRRHPQSQRSFRRTAHPRTQLSLLPAGAERKSLWHSL